MFEKNHVTAEFLEPNPMDQTNDANQTLGLIGKKNDSSLLVSTHSVKSSKESQ
jgi:hypothetical protein